MNDHHTGHSRADGNPSAAGTVVLSCTALVKTYGLGNTAVPVLRGVDLAVRSGESVVIVGASGSGKSTLLHLLGGLDRATSGSVMLLGKDLFSLGARAQGELRNRALGFVYQFHHLLPEFSALENVAMPLTIRRSPDREASDRAAAMLEEVGLGHRLAHRPGRALGWRAPTRSRGSRPRDESRMRPGRRAYGKPRSRERGKGLRPHHRVEPQAPGRVRDGDARSRSRGAHGPQAHHRRRADSLGIIRAAARASATGTTTPPSGRAPSARRSCASFPS